MDSNAYNPFTYESGQRITVPAFPFLENQNTSLQFAVQPASEAQSFELPQSMSLMPTSLVLEEAFMAPQASLPQNICHVPMGSASASAPEHSAQQIRSIKGPGEDKWRRYKPKIAELYAENTLNKVKEIMERDHKFKASTKMYKARIDKWKIGKNVKSAEMEAIVRKKAQRSLMGKKSVFSIRHVPVSESKIDRYWRSWRLLSEGQALRSKATTPPGLECYTPIASPLTTPQKYLISERIAKQVQDYIRGSLDSKAWVATEIQECLNIKTSDRPLNDFECGCLHAIQSFERGESHNAWRVLRIAMSLIEQIVLNESPATIEVLVDLISAYHRRVELPGIASTILKQFSAMSAKIKPQGHPFNQLFAFFIEIDEPLLKDHLGVAHQSQYDCFVQELGPFGWNTLQIQLTMIDSQDESGAEYQKTASSLTLLRDFELALGPSDVRSLEIRGYLAWHYIDKGEPDKAAEIAQSIITLAAQCQSNTFHRVAHTHYILAKAYYELSRAELAEQNIRQAILIRADHWGWEDDDVLFWKLRLAEWLEEWDRPDEAAELRNDYNEILTSKSEMLTLAEEERYQRCVASEC